MKNLKYLGVGFLFGVIFVKAEIVSWFRMQEMFRFQDFFLYGVLASAMAVAMLSVFLIKKYNVRTFSGEPIVFQDKTFNRGHIWGSLIFGVGWAITGACPGPLFAQIGAGFSVVIVTLGSAIGGTWVYGYFRDRLPH
jgi:uncharacterized membrane protein YedE/YeeE